MTTAIDPYLFFDGDCAEAMRFYQKVLGGELEAMIPYSEGPPPQEGDPGDGCGPAEGAPPAEEWADRIMHASLVIDGQRVMASDCPPGQYEKPAGVSISINVESPEAVERIFGELSEGGEAAMKPAETFWSPRFGMLVDRHGVSWMVGCPPAE